MENGQAFEAAETVVQQSVQWLRLAIETTGALIIAIGVVIALWGFVRAFARRHAPSLAPPEKGEHPRNGRDQPPRTDPDNGRLRRGGFADRHRRKEYRRTG